jgi:hypothetical protein
LILQCSGVGNRYRSRNTASSQNDSDLVVVQSLRKKEEHQTRRTDLYPELGEG